MQDNENFIKYYTKNIDERKAKANCIANTLSSTLSSSSSTSSLSPTSSIKRQNIIFRSDDPMKTSTQINSKKTNKQDRLKKICTMALELQTQLQQTKFKFLDSPPLQKASNQHKMQEDCTTPYDQNNKASKPSTNHEINIKNRQKFNDYDFLGENNELNANGNIKRKIHKSSSLNDYMEHQQVEKIRLLKTDDSKFKNITKRSASTNAVNHYNFDYESALQHSSSLDSKENSDFHRKVKEKIPSDLHGRNLDERRLKAINLNYININSNEKLNSLVPLASSSTQAKKVNKQDRLKKICTMALELQTQLQQTKFKFLDSPPSISARSHQHSQEDFNVHNSISSKILSSSYPDYDTKTQVLNKCKNEYDQGTDFYNGNNTLKAKMGKNFQICDYMDQEQIEVNRLFKNDDLKFKNITKRSNQIPYSILSNQITTDPQFDYETSNSSQLNDDEDIDDLERSYRQLLPSESHIKSSIKETREFYERFNSSACEGHQFQTNNKKDPINRSSLDVSRLSFDENSFKKFTDEIVKRYMHEEEMRSQHQAHLLQLREKALIEKTNSELIWLKQMKKRIQSKGDDEKMPLILKKQQEILQRLKREQDNIRHIKQLQRKTSEDRIKVLSQHHKVIKWCRNKLEENTTSSLSSSSSSISSKAFLPNEHCLVRNQVNDGCPISRRKVSEIDDYQTQELQLNEFNGIVKEKLLRKMKQQLSSEKYYTQREKILSLKRRSTDEIVFKRKLQNQYNDQDLNENEQRKQLSNQIIETDYLRRIDSKLKNNAPSSEEKPSVAINDAINRSIIQKPKVNESCKVDDITKIKWPEDKTNEDNKPNNEFSNLYLKQNDKLSHEVKKSQVDSTSNGKLIQENKKFEEILNDRVQPIILNPATKNSFESEPITKILNKIYLSDYTGVEKPKVLTESKMKMIVYEKIHSVCQIVCSLLFKTPHSIKINDVVLLYIQDFYQLETAKCKQFNFSFDLLIYDLAIEYLNEMCLNKTKKVFKDILNNVSIDIVSFITNSIIEDLHLKSTSLDYLKKFKWKNKKKLLDLIDYIIELEMREDEQNWCVYDKEELEAKSVLTDTIFDSLLKDTFDLFANIGK